MAMGADDNPILERIEKVLAELSKTISTPPIPPNADVVETIETTEPSAPEASISAARLNVAIGWIRSRACRDKAFGDDLFFDPAWSILLELYVHHRQRTATSITSLCLAAKVPPSTGLRWVALLEKRGLVIREADPFDKRKSYAQLTPDAIARVERALDDTINGNRQLGIECMRVVN